MVFLCSVWAPVITDTGSSPIEFNLYCKFLGICIWVRTWFRKVSSKNGWISVLYDHGNLCGIYNIWTYTFTTLNILWSLLSVILFLLISFEICSSATGWFILLELIKFSYWVLFYDVCFFFKSYCGYRTRSHGNLIFLSW